MNVCNITFQVGFGHLVRISTNSVTLTLVLKLGLLGLVVHALLVVTFLSLDAYFSNYNYNYNTISLTFCQVYGAKLRKQCCDVTETLYYS